MNDFVLALTFLILFLAGRSYGCEIKLPRVIVKDKNLTPAQISFKHNCPTEYVEKVKNFVCQNTGDFSAQQISRYLNISESTFSMQQNRISVINLNEYLNQNYILGNNKTFFGTKFVNNKNYLSLSSKEDFKVVCDHCEKALGEKNIKLISQNSTNEQVWLKSTIAFEVEAFFPTKIMHPTSEVLAKNLFIKKSTHTISPQSLITDINKVKFLQLRRVLDPSNPISKNDFIKQNLIVAGRHANVVLKASGISLSLKALPLSYGKYGDTVRLRNPKSNKIIIGKIIDYNTVLVEL